MTILAVVFLACSLCADAGIEFLHRFSAMPIDLMQFFFGNHNSPLGGVVLPVDSRLVAAFSRVPYLTSDHIPPRNNPVCHDLWKRSPQWAARAAMKLSNATAPGRLAREGTFLALIGHPAELTRFSEEQLACIYYLGYTPNSNREIPSGKAYGRVLSFLGRPVLKDLGNWLWGGKIFFDLPCDSSKMLGEHLPT
eukprot:Blabericola_migrator_1__7212@NODE_365_length_9399_cov_81_035255_g292_i0_p4_GENE_NODE_365_length_9399_cov_81_035255_g292_i0NODE_365_length_9399_cov_81_035255_g292_i0_p4_ORF_typecomplete_len194_score11_86_NODE_365_length_9399_cov_81_035255_g292_i035914172